MSILRAAGGVAVAAVTSALLLCGCTVPQPLPVETSEAPTGWSQVADIPLTPRTETTLAWSGAEVFVVGGDTGPACPPNANCAFTALSNEGAAFDPVSGTWREIQDAPIDIPPSQSAFAGGQLFISVVGDTGQSALVSYNVDEDRWRTWDTPDDLPRSLVADGDRIIFVSASDEATPAADLVLDTTTGDWSQLPPDPLGPTFDRSITATPAGLVLTARELVTDPGSEGPSLEIVALYDRESGRWSRLPDTGQIGGGTWMWTGDRLVDPQLGTADGGEIRGWEQDYPYGGTLTVPGGEWAPLVDPPDFLLEAWLYSVVASGRFAHSGGYVYDDQRNSWTTLGRPDGAPQEAGPAIWAGDALLVLGGVRWSGTGGIRSPATWMFTPMT